MTYNVRFSFVTNDLTYTTITNVIDDFDFRCGSSDGFDLPQASQLTITMYGNTINGVSVQAAELIGKFCVLAIDTWSSPYMTIGSVTMEAVNADATQNLIRITAYGPLSAISRVQVNRSVIPSSSGYTWWGKIVIDSQIQWGDLNQAIQWGDYYDTTTWADPSFNGLNGTWMGLVPGLDTRTWQASTGVPQDALSFVQAQCEGNDSWCYEYGGNVYVDPLSAYSSDTPDVIDASSVVVFGSLSAKSDLSEKINDVTVTNGTLSGYAADITDITFFGEYPYTSTSTLSASLDMQNIADRILKTHGNGTTSLSTITVDLDQTTTNLLNPQPYLLTINNLPTPYIDPSGNTYQVRGYALRGTTYHIDVDLVMVPKTVWSYAVTSYVMTTDPWNTYLTALSTWNDVP